MKRDLVVGLIVVVKVGIERLVGEWETDKSKSDKGKQQETATCPYAPTSTYLVNDTPISNLRVDQGSQQCDGESKGSHCIVSRGMR